MDALYDYVLAQVTEYITEIQDRAPEDGEPEQVASAVCCMAYDFISTKVSNALS